MCLNVLTPEKDFPESENSQDSQFSVLKSSTTSHFASSQICQKFARCGKSDCLICAQIYRSKKKVEICNNIQDRKLYRLILTVKSSENLDELLKQLYESFYMLRRSKYWLTHIKGGAFRLHVDHTPSGYHPHFEILLELHEDINKKEISELWSKITKNSYVINLQKVENTEEDKSRLVSYILKPSFNKIKNSPLLMEVYKKAVRKRKKLQRFGYWINTKTRKDWKKVKAEKTTINEYQDTTISLEDDQELDNLSMKMNM